MMQNMEAADKEKRKHNSTRMEAFTANADLAKSLATVQWNLEQEVNHLAELRQQVELKEVNHEELRRKISDTHQIEISLKSDTSALEGRNGIDIQGIPWERLNFTRDKYREARLKQYKNYESLGRPRQDLEKECLQVEKVKSFYDFNYNTRLVKSTIVHFQHDSNHKTENQNSFTKQPLARASRAFAAARAPVRLQPCTAAPAVPSLQPCVPACCHRSIPAAQTSQRTPTASFSRSCAHPSSCKPLNI
ncbi:uncharacterized protein LOC133745149 isoform X2 [Rosa rugosa]|uniref:uncharacterized protein LOC133745149 isoform X2 n=1 Tax=Rosa rugosa TaxID=74645 RepID=UPI002B40C5FD|nr:uncharacterized protein LOC133745149 isoform X2 [Rosa rugosa]